MLKLFTRTTETEKQALICIQQRMLEASRSSTSMAVAQEIKDLK